MFLGLIWKNTIEYICIDNYYKHWYYYIIMTLRYAFVSGLVMSVILSHALQKFISFQTSANKDGQFNLVQY